MSQKIILGLISATLFLSGVVHSVKIVKQNHESVLVEEGEVVQLLCTADATVRACNFRSPTQQNYQLFEGANYEGGRVKKYGQSEFDCGLEISNVNDGDNGKWECAISATSVDGTSTSGQKFIEVVVAVPPTDVTLKIGDVQGLQEYKVKIEEHESGEAIDVACVASQARPAPRFVWSMGDTSPIKATVVDTTEDLADDGKATYVQTLKYYPEPRHNDQRLKCTVEHSGYRPDQISERDNEASVKMDILYPPQRQSKPSIFYDMKEGESSKVRMTFSANPKPTEGIWKLGEMELAVGAESVDQRLKSSTFEKGAADGQWVVVLNVKNLENKDSLTENVLKVTNDEGTAEYSFKLALGAKPPAGGGVSPVFVPKGESSSGLAIGVVVVIVLIVLLLILVVVARSKGMLCFAGRKKKDEEAERGAVDKEGSDTESAEHHDTKPDGGAGEGEGEGKPSGASEGDVVDGEARQQQNSKERVSMSTRFTSLFAAVKKSVSAKGNKYEQTESEMKLGDGEQKKDPETGGKEDITYAELDNNALSAGRRTSLALEDEKTQYAEIK